MKILLLVLKGILVGGGAILPGISGGVLCVAFGIYRPLMEFLSHPIKTFKKNVSLLFPFGIGWLIGFLLFAKLVEIVFSSSYGLAVWLFIGLIAGTLPSIFREAGAPTRKSTAVFAFLLIAVFSFFAFLNAGTEISVDGNVFTFFLCGVMWGLSLVVPGMTSSSILIFFGLYEPLTAGITSLDMSVILPIVAGIAITAVLLSRAVNSLFEKRGDIAYYSVIAFVVSTTLAIIPTDVSIPLAALLFVVGFVSSFLLDGLSDKIGNK